MSLLQGVIPPLVTPLTPHQQLDVPSLEKLIRYQLQAGVHGLFLLGTTGEGPSLPHALKAELVKQTCLLAGTQVPVLVNISDTAMAESVELAQHAARCGARALVVTAPYYFPLEQEDLWLYLQQLLKQLPLPLYLYNMPSHVKVSIGTEVLQRALQEPGIVGIKDSSGDRSYLKSLIQLAQDRPGWSVMVGPEELFVETLRWGGHGGVLGGANLYPRLLVQLYHAVRSQDLPLVDALITRLHWYHQHVLQIVPRANGWLTGLKTALALEGLCQEVFAEPLHAMAAEERKELEENLKTLRTLQEF